MSSEIDYFEAIDVFSREVKNNLKSIELPNFDRVNSTYFAQIKSLLTDLRVRFYNKKLGFVVILFFTVAIFFMFNSLFSQNFQDIYYQKSAQAICNSMQDQLQALASKITPGNQAELAWLLDANSSVEAQAFSAIEQIPVPADEKNYASSAYAAATATILNQRQLASYLRSGNLAKEMLATSALAVSSHNLSVYLGALNLETCSFGRLS